MLSFFEFAKQLKCNGFLISCIIYEYSIIVHTFVNKIVFIVYNYVNICLFMLHI